MVKLSTRYLEKFITEKDINSFQKKLTTAHFELHSNDIGGKGWLNLPANISSEELLKIKSAAQRINSSSDVLIVIGIGGSYLGARAGIEFLRSLNYNYFLKTKIFFIGNSLSSADIFELLKFCESKDVSINVVSKSGGTIECAVAFRIFRRFLEKKYGKEKSRERIYCTTDPTKGLLKKMACEEGYETFEIPPDVGGRYSVLSAVGLLPLSVAGADVNEILHGASDAMNTFNSLEISKNDCYKYSVLRNILYSKGKAVEILASYESRLKYLLEWWKQLFGESEGKCKKGIFPSSLVFTSDLHSMGQFMQDGNPIFFETIITVLNDPYKILVPHDSLNVDKLNYLVGKTVGYINSQAFLATADAHTYAEVPNIHLQIDDTNEYELGYLIYFFQKSCAISGYMLGVNPFDQPGVEAYKRNMFKLLGRPEDT